MGNNTSGQVAGQTAGVTGAAIILIMFLAKHYQWNDVTESVAAAVVTITGWVGGNAYHVFANRTAKSVASLTITKP